MKAQANVGGIFITSADLGLAHQISTHVNSWLAKEKWNEAVSLKVASNTEATLENTLQVVLEPGEYQSNGRKTLMFQELPDLQVLETEIKKWLYEVE